MLRVDAVEVDSESALLDSCSQFTSKTKRSMVCLPLQHGKCSAEQESAEEGSEILERRASRIFQQANLRIYGQWEITARLIPKEGKMKKSKLTVTQEKEEKKYSNKEAEMKKKAITALNLT